MARTIMIVEDKAIDRQILNHSLSGEYNILEAENGKEALHLLRQNHTTVSVVLLSVVISGMDGFEILRRIRGDRSLSRIPVVMAADIEDEGTRVNALVHGASDVLLKPFNPDIVRHCIKNCIALRETASSISEFQRDRLTGLYNREAFFEKVAERVALHEPGYYVLSCFDIDNFKLINDQYGIEEGDRLLREVGQAVQGNIREIGGVAGRVSADNFAALFPAEIKVTKVLSRILEKRLVFVNQKPVTFSMGRYVITDLSLPASFNYDRAYIAKQSVKGRYDQHVAYFDEAMLRKLLHDREIIGDMETALKEGQFEAWLQPQYNHSTGELSGAETLVRWRHPRKGIIAPGEFIPLFEKNGFIYEMDKAVWRQACAYLRRWREEGRASLSISVNISRYDVLRPDLIDVLSGLIREYALSPELLRLEITESAFTDESERIISVVRKLVDLGFTVEIDDFGSGYSSLNTLKNVPAQVVKLDMKFLEGNGESRRGGNILESIVRMTKWLGMTVLAEGVENVEHADFLRSIGCELVQGYLYAYPMPPVEFERLLQGGNVNFRSFTGNTTDALFNDSFWDPASLDSVVFNKYSSGACVYEFYKGKIEIVRVTEKYIHTVFGSEMSAADAMNVAWENHITPETARKTENALKRSLETNEEVTGEYQFLDLPGCAHETYLRSTLRVIASAGDRHLVFCTSVNVTEQKEAEKKATAAAGQLKAVMDHVSCGITAITFGEEGAEYLLRNSRYYELLGYTKEEFEAKYTTMPIYEEDRYFVLTASRRVYSTGKPTTLEYRAVKADGSVVWLRDSMTMTQIEGIEKPVQISIFTDITEARRTESRLELLTNNIPGGMAIYEGTPDSLEDIRLTDFSDGFCRLFGYTRDEYEKLARVNPLGRVFAEDLPQIFENVTKMAKDGIPMDLIYRAKSSDGTGKWINVRAVMGYPNGNRISVNAVFFDVTELRETLEKLRVSEEVNRLAIQQSKNVVCQYDVVDRKLSIPPNANLIFALDSVEEDIPYSSVREGKIAPDSVDAYLAFFESILNGKESGEVLFQRRSSIGWRWLRGTFTTIFSDEGKPTKAVISFSDETESIEREEAYAKWKQSFGDRSPESYSLYHCNVSKNSVGDSVEGGLIDDTEILGTLKLDERTAKYAEMKVFEEDKNRFLGVLERNALLSQYRRGKRKNTLEYREKLSERDFRWIRLTVELVDAPYSSDVKAYFFFEDIDAPKREELRIIKRAETDPLTGILNRTTFAQRVDSIIGSSGPDAKHALLMLDLDDFKKVNDIYGHGAGDRTLIHVAEGLRKGSRRDDLVGRLGGDEFVVFLSNINGEEVAAGKAKQICNMVRDIQGSGNTITTCIGIALYPQNGFDFDSLYQLADETMYQVKNSGKNNYAFCGSKINNKE